MNINSLTNIEIEQKLRLLINRERKITTEILEIIHVVEQRKIHLDRGYGSLFDWLTRGFGYSESAAQRRIQAARLLGSVPGACEKLNSGILNLTNVSKAQSVIRKHEQLTGAPVDLAKKVEILEGLEMKSGSESERYLFSQFPEVCKIINFEKQTWINENELRVSMTFTAEQMKNIERCRELLSHQAFGESLSQIIARLADEFLKQKDPARKMQKNSHSPMRKNTAATKPRVMRSRLHIPFWIRREILRKANNQCEYVDPDTKNRCKSRFQIEIDHIKPIALGGGNDINNLRCLCRAHNQRRAELIFGKSTA